MESSNPKAPLPANDCHQHDGNEPNVLSIFDTDGAVGGDVDGMLPPLVEASVQQNPLPCAFVASTNPPPSPGVNTNGDVNLNGHDYHYYDDGDDLLPPLAEPRTQWDTSILTHASPTVADGSSDPGAAANLDIGSMRRCMGRSALIFRHTGHAAIRRIFGPRHCHQLRDVLRNSSGIPTALSTVQGPYEPHSDTCPRKPTNHAEMSWRSNEMSWRRSNDVDTYILTPWYNNVESRQPDQEEQMQFHAPQPSNVSSADCIASLKDV